MSKPTNEFDHLLNDLPFEERKRIAPYLIESHKLHVWQCKQKAIHSHNLHMRKLDELMRNLDEELAKFNTP